MKYESEHCAGVFVCTVFVCHVEKRGIVAKFLWPDALPVANQQESLTGPHPFSSHSTRGRGVTPFMSALRRQYPWFTWKKTAVKMVCVHVSLSFMPIHTNCKIWLEEKAVRESTEIRDVTRFEFNSDNFQSCMFFPPSKFTKCYEVIVVECAYKSLMTIK